MGMPTKMQGVEEYTSSGGFSDRRDRSRSMDPGRFQGQVPEGSPAMRH